MRIFSDITKTIGHTPLVGMKRLGVQLPGQVLLKLEFFNPLGSVKDRIGIQMIEAAEVSGSLKPGLTVLEPTSGNTGIALAFICASKGYPLTLVMPDSMSVERRTLLLMFGAELILTPAANGMRGAVAKALELHEKSPGKYFLTKQFENLANPLAHAEGTALEIWRDTDGGVDVVVSGVGTGGTITGVGQVLKVKKPSVRMVAVEPDESPMLSDGKAGPHKIQGIGAGFIPPVLDRSVIDEVIRVSSNDAMAMARRAIKEEGIPFGISSGAALAAALKVAARTDSKDKCIVAVIPSYTERYLSTLLAEGERKVAQELQTQSIDPTYLSKVPVADFT